MLAAAASFVNLLLYSLFYKFSAVIWSLNVPFSIGQLVPHIRPWVSQEGIEGYMLYVLTFADIALTLALFRILVRIGRLGVAAAAAATPVLILCYYSSIDFYPPVPEIASGPSLAISLVAVSLVIAASLIIYKIRGGMLTAFFAVILLPVCFVTTAPISQADYCFTIGPALRMLHGFRLSEIYFQYDLLMPLLAALWLKIGLGPNSLQVVGQFSCYLFVLGGVPFLEAVFHG